MCTAVKCTILNPSTPQKKIAKRLCGQSDHDGYPPLPVNTKKTKRTFPEPSLFSNLGEIENSCNRVMTPDAPDRPRPGSRLTMNPVKLAKDTVEAAGYHWANRNFNWPMSVYIVLVHFAAVVGLCTVRSCKVETLMLANLLWPFT